MNTTKNNGFKFLEFIKVKEIEITNYGPVAGSFAVLKCEEKYLFCYNKWRKQWELPAGQREEGETPKECAIRELCEESGQIVEDLEFKGLLKVENVMNNSIKYNPVYFTVIDSLQPFIKNEETTEIRLWDLKGEIGCVDEVDLKILDYM